MRTIARSLWYSLDAAETAFGVCQPGTTREIRDAIVVRVYSESSWELTLAPHGPSATGGDDHVLPMSRLAWRSAPGAYQAFRDILPVTVARGGPTGPAGTELRIDLRLSVTDTDPVAPLLLNLGIDLEPR